MRRLGWNLSITAIASLVCALAFPVSADADTITLVWDPSSDASVVGYMVYVEGPSGYSRSFDAGTSVVFPFTEAVAGQQYCFTVASYAAGSIVGPRSSQVCGYSNMAPVFAGVADRSTAVGQAVSLQLDADDPEAYPLTYTATGLPPGLTLQSSTGFISGTPTTVGTYNVTVTARDESLSSVQTFTWSIVAPDGMAPSVTITNPTSASSYSTTSSTITVGGSASDNVGVSQVTWVNNRGGSGTASGRTSWSVSTIGLVGGSNVITVTARDAAGNQTSDTLTVNYSAPAGPLALTSLTADRSAPQPTGTSVTFTATVVGGTAPQQFKWWVYDDRVGWYVTRDWSTANTWTWTPSVANSAYRVSVWVRSATSSADLYDNSQSGSSIAFPISGPSSSTSSQEPNASSSGGVLTLTSISADRPAPQPAGSSITFTATASGGASPYQYKWWIYDGANWITTQQWATSNRWTWTPSAGNSAYRVAVWVRNAGSSGDVYDNSGSNGSIAYPISRTSPSTLPSSTTPSGGVLTLTGIGADRVAPQPVGSSVTFTALATGGAAPYQYKWWIYDGANWVVRRDWSTSSTWTWTPTVANVSYRVAVWVRNAGSSADAYDNAASNGSISFPISLSTSSTPSQPPPTTSWSTGDTLILNGISTSRPAPSPAGVAVTFTAWGSGGIGPQQFKWFVYDGATWWAQTGWSTSNTWTWAPPEAFSYRVAVWVRNAGSTADAYDNPQSNGSIGFVVY